MPFVYAALTEEEIINMTTPFSCSLFRLQLIPDSTEQQHPKPQLRNSKQQKGEAPSLTFRANKKLFGLSIVGVPASRGWLKITASRSRAKQPSQVLYIAVQLAPCLWGFESRNISKDGLLQRVRKFDLEQLKLF